MTWSLKVTRRSPTVPRGPETRSCQRGHVTRIHAVAGHHVHHKKEISKERSGRRMLFSEWKEHSCLKTTVRMSNVTLIANRSSSRRLPSVRVPLAPPPVRDLPQPCSRPPRVQTAPRFCEPPSLSLLNWHCCFFLSK